MEANLQSYRRILFQIIRFFSDDFMKQCKDNENEDQFILLEVNLNIKLMAIEKVLYAQLVNLRQKNFK